jgi:hypothetical protein
VSAHWSFDRRAGADQSDAIRIGEFLLTFQALRPGGGPPPSTVQARIGGVSQVSLIRTGKVVASGQAGDDDIRMASVFLRSAPGIRHFSLIFD